MYQCSIYYGTLNVNCILLDILLVKAAAEDLTNKGKKSADHLFTAKVLIAYFKTCSIQVFQSSM